MKKQMSSVVLCLSLLLACLSQLWADSLGDLANNYYEQFQGADSTSKNIVWGDFNKNIPPAERDEIFALMLDRGAKDPDNGRAVAYILSTLEAYGPGVEWSAHLEGSVLAQARHKDASVRAVLVGALSNHNKTKYRALVLSFLNDSNERVRRHTINTVGLWADGGSLLSQYVATHATNPEHVATLRQAREFLGLPTSPP